MNLVLLKKLLEVGQSVLQTLFVHIIMNIIRLDVTAYPPNVVNEINQIFRILIGTFCHKY